MTTPVWLTGFEHGVATPVTSGGGLADAIVSTPTVVSTQHNSGAYALQLNLTGAAGGMYLQKNIISGQTLVVLRFYIRFETLPAADCQLGQLSTTDGNQLRWYYKQSLNQFQCYFDTGTVQTYGTTLSAGVWYRFDLRVNVGSNPRTCDWQVDGNAQTQATLGVAGSTFNSAGLRLGTSSAHTYNAYYDDLVASITTGDYPIGPGGTELLKPTSDGTHNAGTNVMEDPAGNDIGAVSANPLVNSVPMGDTTNYIKQSATGTGNYAEVNCADISATHSAIVGAMAILAYRAATATTDKGGCIVTKDNFSTSTTVWGASGATADYSETTVFWKSVIVAGAANDTTVNALEFRMGYSDDANPVPWWVDVACEVAYTTSSGTQFTSTPSGALTPAGDIVKQANAGKAGALTPGGGLIKSLARALSGALTPAGGLTKQDRTSKGGALTPAGALTAFKLVLKAIGGALTPAGGLTKQDRTNAGGAATPAGGLTKQDRTSKGGALTPAGALTAFKLVLKAIGGALTPAGGLTKQDRTSKGGAATPAGGIAKMLVRAIGGALTPGGTLAGVKAFVRALGGALTPGGTLTRQDRTNAGGTIAPAGTLTKQDRVSKSGATTPAGGLVKQARKSLSGILNTAGSIAKSIRRILAGLLGPIGSLSSQHTGTEIPILVDLACTITVIAAPEATLSPAATPGATLSPAAAPGATLSPAIPIGTLTPAARPIAEVEAA